LRDREVEFADRQRDLDTAQERLRRCSEHLRRWESISRPVNAEPTPCRGPLRAQQLLAPRWAATSAARAGQASSTSCVTASWRKAGHSPRAIWKALRCSAYGMRHR
jgi:hypothetical protein